MTDWKSKTKEMCVCAHACTYMCVGNYYYEEAVFVIHTVHNDNQMEQSKALPEGVKKKNEKKKKLHIDDYP